jgi:hypothetical protein
MVTKFQRSLDLSTTGLDPATHVVLERDRIQEPDTTHETGVTDVVVRVTQVDESDFRVDATCVSRSAIPGAEYSRVFSHYGETPGWLQTLIDEAVAEFHGMEQHGWGA